MPPWSLAFVVALSQISPFVLLSTHLGWRDLHGGQLAIVEGVDMGSKCLKIWKPHQKSIPKCKTKIRAQINL